MPRKIGILIGTWLIDGRLLKDLESTQAFMSVSPRAGSGINSNPKNPIHCRRLPKRLP